MESTIHSLGAAPPVTPIASQPAEPTPHVRRNNAPSAERAAEDGRRQALRETSGRLEISGRTAEFSYDKDLHRVVVKIYSGSSEPREVVRQLPPKEFVEFAARFRDMVGLLFDEQA